MAASGKRDPGEGGAESGITCETYWARLKVCGITKIRLHTEKRWVCRRGHGTEQQYPIYIDEPEHFSPEEREAMVEEYRKRYAFFDC